MNLSRWYVMSPSAPERSNLTQCRVLSDPKLAKLDRHVGSFCGGAWNDYAETQAILVRVRVRVLGLGLGSGLRLANPNPKSNQVG